MKNYLRIVGKIPRDLEIMADASDTYENFGNEDLDSDGYDPNKETLYEKMLSADLPTEFPMEDLDEIIETRKKIPTVCAGISDNFRDRRLRIGYKMLDYDY